MTEAELDDLHSSVHELGAMLARVVERVPAQLLPERNEFLSTLGRIQSLHLEALAERQERRRTRGRR